MDIRIEEVLSSLRQRHIHASFAENSEDARQKVTSLISQDAVVGIGDSTTMRQLGIPQTLKEKGIQVLDPIRARQAPERSGGGPAPDEKDS